MSTTTTTTTTTTTAHSQRKLDVSSSSAFVDDSDESDCEDALAIRRHSDGRNLRSTSNGPMTTTTSTTSSSRRFEEMEIANWCTVCEKLIVPPGSIVGEEEGMVIGRTSTIKARKKRDVGDDLDMPVIVNGQVKPVFSRKMKRNPSGGISSGLKQVNTASRLSSTRNLASLLASATTTPPPQPTYNIELYCSESCATKDRAITQSQIEGLAGLYGGMRVNTNRRDSEWSEAQLSSPFFVSSDTESTGATSVTSDIGDKTATTTAAAAAAFLPDEFDYFRMQTDGVNNGLMERQRRRSNQSGRAVVHASATAAAPVMAPQANVTAASSDSLSSLCSSSVSEDGGYPVSRSSRSSSHGVGGTILKPMTPLKSSFGLASSPSSRPSMSNRSLSQGQDVNQAVPRTSTNNTLHRMYSTPHPHMTASEFGSAPAAASNSLHSYAQAFHRTPSSRDVTSIGGSGAGTRFGAGSSSSRRRDSSVESRSWKVDWDHVIPIRNRSGVEISAERGRMTGSLGLTTRADDARTPTQSLVQDVLSRHGAPAMDRSRSRTSATSSDCEPVLEEEAEPVTIRRKSPCSQLRLDSPTMAITIGDKVFSQASSPPSVLFCQSLPRQRTRTSSRATAETVSNVAHSLVVETPIAKPPPNAWSWNSLEKSGAKVYGLPVKATGTVNADGEAVKDGIAVGRLFYFQN